MTLAAPSRSKSYIDLLTHPSVQLLMLRRQDEWLAGCYNFVIT